MGGNKVVPSEILNIDSKKISFDELMEEITGGFGRYHLILILLICAPLYSISVQSMSWTFVGSEQVFPGNSSIFHQWEISPESRSYIKATIQSCYFAGQLVGAYVTGVMGDRYGRKFAMYICLVIQSVCGLLLSVAPNWWSFGILKFAIGFAHPGLSTISILYCLEIVGRSHRHICAVLGAIFASAGMLLLPLTAYFVRDQRIFNVIISAPLCLFLIYWWALPESPQWLNAKGNVQKVEKIIRRAAKVNRKEFPENWTSRLNTTPAQHQISPGAMELFKTPEIRKRIFVCTIAWSVNNMLYYGLTMKSDLNGGSLYISFALAALMELPADIISFFLLNICGRKLLQSMSFVTCGVLLFLNGIFSPYASNTVLLSFILISKMASTCCGIGAYTHLPEMMPTLLRNTAVGYCGSVSRIGSILSSYISFWLVDHFGVLVFTLPLSLLSLISAALIQCLLPETKGKSLPETVDEVEKKAD